MWKPNVRKLYLIFESRNKGPFEYIMGETNEREAQKYCRQRREQYFDTRYKIKLFIQVLPIEEI